MPSFADFTPEGLPDYDATPEELQPPTELQAGYDEPQDDPFQSFDPDIAFQSTSNEEPDPPGAGDSYQGTDPSAFSEQDGTVDEQQAAAPDAHTLGQSDDPEAQEAVGDEAEGDDEDDTSDPAQVDSGEAIDATDEVQYPEQGIDADELTIREPEQVHLVTLDDRKLLLTDQELVEELRSLEVEDREAFLRSIFDEILQERQRIADEFASVLDTNNIFEYLLDIDDKVTNQMANFAFDDFEDVELDGEDNDDLGDGFTTPSLLAEMSDIIGGVDQDTFLTEFQWLHQEEI